MTRKLPVLAAIALFATPAFAEGDAAAGKQAFRKCLACHNIEGPNKIGPTLAGIVGKPIASVEGFRYSQAMIDFAAGGKIWTEELLAEYLTSPRTVVVGGSMAFAGLRSPDEIANLIAYLKDPSAAD